MANSKVTSAAITADTLCSKIEALGRTGARYREAYKSYTSALSSMGLDREDVQSRSMPGI
jgi:hypothetical protein